VFIKIIFFVGSILRWSIRIREKIDYRFKIQEWERTTSFCEAISIVKNNNNKKSKRNLFSKFEIWACLKFANHHLALQSILFHV
jgi:hypothetical protein